MPAWKMLHVFWKQHFNREKSGESTSFPTFSSPIAARASESRLKNANTVLRATATRLQLGISFLEAISKHVPRMIAPLAHYFEDCLYAPQGISHKLSTVICSVLARVSAYNDTVASTMHMFARKALFCSTDPQLLRLGKQCVSAMLCDADSSSITVDKAVLVEWVRAWSAFWRSIERVTMFGCAWTLQESLHSLRLTCMCYVCICRFASTFPVRQHYHL